MPPGSRLASPLTVLVVDDHTILREGLKKIICNSNEFIVTAEADSGQAAIQRVRDADFDVVLPPTSSCKSKAIRLRSKR